MILKIGSNEFGRMRECVYEYWKKIIFIQCKEEEEEEILYTWIWNNFKCRLILKFYIRFSKRIFGVFSKQTVKVNVSVTYSIK